MAAGEQRARSDEFEKKWTRISMWVLASSPVLAPIGLSLLIGACAGLYMLGGPKAAPFGAVFVAAFGLLVYGLVEDDTLWRDVGVVLLAISSMSFFVAPALSPRAKARKRKPRPVTAGRLSSLSGTVLVGAVLAVIGYGNDEWWILLFGAMTVSTTTSVGIAMWIDNRRSKEDESVS